MTPTSSPIDDPGPVLSITWDWSDVGFFIPLRDDRLRRRDLLQPGRPPSAIAWVLAIAFMPIVGITWFLLIGAGRLPEHRRLKQREVLLNAVARVPATPRTSMSSGT